MQILRNGKKMDYTCAAAVAMDDVIVVGTVVGIASTAGAIGDIIALDVEGVYELKANTAAITQGAKVYWDATNKEITADDNDGANVAAGVAWAAKAPTVLVAAVKLNV